MYDLAFAVSMFVVSIVSLEIDGPEMLKIAARSVHDEPESLL
jgi:hypothetical protein